MDFKSMSCFAFINDKAQASNSQCIVLKDPLSSFSKFKNVSQQSPCVGALDTHETCPFKRDPGVKSYQNGIKNATWYVSHILRRSKKCNF